METWRDVPGWEGLYQTSDAGRVRVLPRLRVAPNGKSGRLVAVRLRGRVLKSALNNGYPQVMLSRSGSRVAKCTRTVKVQTLVMETFKGPKPKGLEVLHRDHNRANNRFSNLRYGTRKENSIEMSQSDRRPNAKLTVLQALWIKANPDQHSPSGLAAEFGVSKTTVSAIRNGHSWAHVGL